MEVRRLKCELERMNDKQRESMQEAARRVTEAERRYTMQVIYKQFCYYILLIIIIYLILFAAMATRPS